MDDGLLLRSLKRLHDECESVLRKEKEGTEESIVNRYNLLLDKFEDKYPEIIKSNEIERLDYSSTESTKEDDNEDEMLNTIQEIKFKTFELADSLDISEKDYKDISQRSEFTLINISAGSGGENGNMKLAGGDRIISDVEDLRITPDLENKLKKLVKEYDREVESSQPDYERLRDIMNEMYKHSGKIARKLVMDATERGLYILK
jgi:hypothetical protein